MPDRKQRGKISTVAGLDPFLAEYNHVPAPPADYIQIDTGNQSAKDTAANIIKHFLVLE